MNLHQLSFPELVGVMYDVPPARGFPRTPISKSVSLAALLRETPWHGVCHHGSVVGHRQISP